MEESAGAKAQLCLRLYGTTKNRALIQSKVMSGMFHFPSSIIKAF
jgi:hypothetical protein